MDTDSPRVNQFKRDLETAQNFNKKMCARWDNCDKIYHGDARMPDWTKNLVQSELKVAHIFQHVETIKPRIMDPEPRFLFHPIEPTDDRVSDILNLIIGVQLKADHFVIKQYPWIHSAMVDGLGVVKVAWDQQEQTLPKHSLGFDESGQPVKNVEYQTMITTNRPTIMNVDNRDFFPDPAAVDDQSWEYVYHRLWYSMSDLVALEKSGKYQGIKDLNSADDESAVRGMSETPEEAKARREGKYAVYERWHRDGTVMSMCGNVVLQDDPNPFFHGQIPFVAFSTIPNPRSLVGISEVEKLEPIQLAMWINKNQRMDYIAYANNYVMIMDPHIPGANSMRMHPGKVIPAMQGQRVEQLQHTANVGPAMEDSNELQSWMQSMSGASPMMGSMGEDPNAMNNVTATVGSLVSDEGNKRMMVKKLQFRLACARVAKMMAQLNHQYLSSSEVDRMIGGLSEDAWRGISPHDIPMFLDVVPESMNEAMSKTVELNQNLELINMISQLHGLPFADGTQFDIKPGLEQMIKLKDQVPDKYFPPLTQPTMGAPIGVSETMQGPTMEDQTQDMSAVQ